MKNSFNKTILVLALFCGLSAGANAQTFNDGTLVYSIISGTDVRVGDGTSLSGNGLVAGTGYAGALVIPATVVDNGTTYSVTAIGTYAFDSCSSITGTLTIPNSVDSIGNYAFRGCSGLSGDLIIPNSVTFVGGYAFRYCTSLTSVTIGNAVTTFGDGSFQDDSTLTVVNFNATNCSSMGRANYPVFQSCPALTTLNIGNNVENIPPFAFYNDSSLTSIYVAAITPPQVGINAFYNVDTTIPVYVPCGTASDYQSAWSDFTNIIEDIAPAVSLQSGDATMGTVNIIQSNTCTNDEARIEATANAGYRFVQWNDGNTDNPRTLNVTQDTVFVAEFEAVNAIADVSHTSLRIYPNAVSNGRFTLSGGQGKAEIYTMQGVTVGSYSLTEKETIIDVSHLAGGVYFVKVGSTTRKLVVSR